MDYDAQILSILIAIVVAIIVTGFALLIHSGLLYNPRVRCGLPPLSGVRIAYKFIRGAYSGWQVGSTFTEVTSIAPASNILGIFYDNPNSVAEEECRCAVGCVIDGLEDSVISLLKKKEFETATLPSVEEAIISDFPYTTPFSIRFASAKVYPAMYQFVSEKDLCAYPMLEIYEGSRILYMAPLSKQEEFFVPEARSSVVSADESSSVTSSEESSFEDIAEKDDYKDLEE